jgi:hypothetical protein
LERTFIAYIRLVSRFRTWKTFPNVPRPINLRNSKSRGVSARFVCRVELRGGEKRRQEEWLCEGKPRPWVGVND